MLAEQRERAVAAASATRKPPTAEATFEAHYELQGDILGKGANGCVQRARCRRTGRSVAVKSFDKRRMTEDALVRLRTELEVHQSLTHSSIVRVLGVYDSKTTAHLVMEELLGGELHDWLDDRDDVDSLDDECLGSISESEAAGIATRLLQAVAYLHQRGIVHCDIKPANVVFAQRSGLVVKLIDFGSAVRLGTDLSQRQKLVTLPPFTVGYAAPEVVSGRGLDFGADLWSVGSVMYSVLTGDVACRGDTKEAHRKNLVGLVDFGSAFHCLPGDAQHFLQTLLSADPCKRCSAREALQHPWLRRVALEAAAATGATLKAPQELQRLRGAKGLSSGRSVHSVAKTVIASPLVCCVTEAAWGVCSLLSKEAACGVCNVTLDRARKKIAAAQD